MKSHFEGSRNLSRKSGFKRDLNDRNGAVRGLAASHAAPGDFCHSIENCSYLARTVNRSCIVP